LFEKLFFVPRRRLCFADGQSPQARLRVAGLPAPSRSIGPVKGRSCVSAGQIIVFHDEHKE